jgi:hypothetical protein
MDSIEDLRSQLFSAQRSIVLLQTQAKAHQQLVKEANMRAGKLEKKFQEVIQEQAREVGQIRARNGLLSTAGLVGMAWISVKACKWVLGVFGIFGPGQRLKGMDFGGVKYV